MCAHIRIKVIFFKRKQNLIFFTFTRSAKSDGDLQTILYIVNCVLFITSTHLRLTPSVGETSYNNLQCHTLVGPERDVSSVLNDLFDFNI